MYEKILVSIDLNDKKSIKAIIPTVLGLAERFSSEFYFLHVIPDFVIRGLEEYLPGNWRKDQEKKTEKAFNDIIKKSLPDNIKLNFAIEHGPVYDKVIDYSDKIRADLIVVSAVGASSKDYMLGTNASKVARHASVSVLVVRD